MCEILIKATPGASADDTIHFQMGDVAAVMPDGHQWGIDERLPKFWLIKIVGLPVSTVEKYTQPKSTGLFSPMGLPLFSKPREFTFDINKIPNAIKNQLNNNGFISITAAQANQIRQYVKNKTTGTYEA